MSSPPTVELYDALGQIAGAVTKAYRTQRPYAVNLDRAHQRLVHRHGLHGTCPADNPDLMFCGQAIRDLADHERRNRLFDALQRLDAKPYIGNLLRQRKEAS